MKTPWVLSAAVFAAGHVLIATALAAPPAGGMAVPQGADLVRVQALQPPGSSADRMSRLRQHHSILQNALRAGPAEAPEPQARALQPPEAVVATVPRDRTVTCEAAARMVADFGFSDIGRPDCSGDRYEFSAMRDGTAYAIAISPATGEITEVSRQ